MNPETTLAVRKAIQYFSQNVERERLVGGAIPDDNGLIVALKPEHKPDHNNGAGDSGAVPTDPPGSPAIGANGTHHPGAGTPSELQGLLVIPDRGSDYGIIMEKIYDGTPVGSGGDVVSRDTRIEIASWSDDHLDTDGSLSAAYVASLGDRILNSAIKTPAKEESREENQEDNKEPLSPEQLINAELDRAAATGDYSRMPGQAPDTVAGAAEHTEERAEETEEQAAEQTTAGPEQAQIDDGAVESEHSLEHPSDRPSEDPSEGLPGDSSEDITQDLTEHVHHGSAPGADSGDDAKPAGVSATGEPTDEPTKSRDPVEDEARVTGSEPYEAAQPEAPDEAELAGTPQADEEDRQNKEQARQLQAWIAEHGDGAFQRSPAEQEQQEHHQQEHHQQEHHQREQTGHQRHHDGDGRQHRQGAYAREDYAPEAPLGQDIPGEYEERPQHAFRAFADSPGPAETPRASDTHEEGSQGSRVYDPDAAKRREARIEPEDNPATSQEEEHSRTTTSGRPENPGSPGGPEADQRPTTYSEHIRSGLHEDHPERDAGLQSETYDWLAKLSTGKTQTPEQRQYLIAKHRSGKIVNKVLLKKKPQPPQQLATIPEPETGAIDKIADSDRGPGIVVPMISKGGTGKTTVSIETAFALAMMFGAHGNNTSSRTGRVLLLDMNLTNPDLAHRIAVDGSGTTGLKDLINGDHLSRVVNRTVLPNLDVMFLPGRRDNDKGILPDVLGDAYAMNSLISAFLTNQAYDAIVVDTANTLPGEEDNPASYALTMWANVADARYLVLQPEIASFRNAALFATRLKEALGYENSELVPVINSFPTKKVYDEAPITKAMADKRRATHEAVAVLEREPSIHVVKPRGQGDAQYLTTPLFVPDYPEEIRGFAAEGRPISMFSQTFASAYSRVALDAVRRMVNNRQDSNEGNGR